MNKIWERLLKFHLLEQEMREGALSFGLLAKAGTVSPPLKRPGTSATHQAKEVWEALKKYPCCLLVVYTWVLGLLARDVCFGIHHLGLHLCSSFSWRSITNACCQMWVRFKHFEILEWIWSSSSIEAPSANSQKTTSVHIISIFWEKEKRKRKTLSEKLLHRSHNFHCFLEKKVSQFQSLRPRFWPDLLNDSSSLLCQGSCLVNVQFKLLLCINITYSMWDHCHGTCGVLPETGSNQQALMGVKETRSRSLTCIACIPCRCSPFISWVLALPWCRMRKLLKSSRDFTSFWICCPQISSDVHSMR